MNINFEPMISKCNGKNYVHLQALNKKAKKENRMAILGIFVLAVVTGVICITTPPYIKAAELVEVENESLENVQVEGKETVEEVKVEVSSVLDTDFMEDVDSVYQEVTEKEVLLTAQSRDEIGLSVKLDTVTMDYNELEVWTEDEVLRKEDYMQIDTLTVSNIQDVPVLTGYSFKRGPLSERYSYALYDTAGNRTDIDDYLLEVLEESCYENNVNPHIMLGIIMTESEGHANAKNKNSSATGLCQFLSSSGEWTYEVLLGNGEGTYTHDMSYNPEISIRMGAAAMGYWLRTKGNYYNAIQAYRGKTDISGYTSVINSHIGKVGLSVEQFY